MKRKFGELEIEILQILKNGKKMTVKQVLMVLGNDNKYTTIMTVMNRLFTKKILLREKNGLQYEYWLEPSPQKIPSFFEKIKNKALGVKSSEMICYLLESAEDISEEELLEMEKLIQKAKEKKHE